MFNGVWTEREREREGERGEGIDECDDFFLNS